MADRIISVSHIKSQVERKRKRKLKKGTMCMYEIFQGLQNCLCFYSSTKTEAVLFFLVGKYKFFNRANFMFFFL